MNFTPQETFPKIIFIFPQKVKTLYHCNLNLRQITVKRQSILASIKSIGANNLSCKEGGKKKRKKKMVLRGNENMRIHNKNNTTYQYKPA